MNEQITLFEDNPEYDAFVEKFKPKKTTDDCYTPPEIFETVVDWACAEYGIDRNKIVRPFYPGGDYENFQYPYGCIVLDNPPFSMLRKILEFYLDNGIEFFLFAPSLTSLSGKKTWMRCCHIIADCDITYENGAVVRTSFITSFDRGVVIRSAPELKQLVDKAGRERLRLTKVELPKYEYPNHVITAAMVQRYSKYGVNFSVRAEDCMQVTVLDAQKEHGKVIFGSGLLLSQKAAAEKAAAEKAAAEKAAAEKAAAEKAAAEKAGKIIWKLSEREWEIVKSLGARKELGKE